MTLCLSVIILTSSFNIITKVEDKKEINLDKLGSSVLNYPTPLKMYELIDHYSDVYKIPKHIAFNVAYLETKYKGPFDWKYKHNLSSPAGAVGPMQVMPTTATYIQNKIISKENLKNNLELNIQTSMKLLNKLYKMYPNWKLVCGAYNTGRPMINSYANFCVNNTNYRKNWKRL
jgi:soluble lytic murein transglycosylase-like protein